METEEEVLEEIIEQEGELTMPNMEQIEKYTRDRNASPHYDTCKHCSTAKKESHTVELFRVNKSNHKIYKCSKCNDWSVGAY
jgi:hypothetical protein